MRSNRAQRVVVGFGLGSSVVRTQTQLYYDAEGQNRLLRTFETNAESSSKPGVAATALTFFYPFLPLFVKIVTVPTVLIVAWWLGGRVVSRVVIERMDKFLNRK